MNENIGSAGFAGVNCLNLLDIGPAPPQPRIRRHHTR